MALEEINRRYFLYAVGSNVGKETPNDISSRCIICNDKPKEKRLHLYRKNSYESDAIHCFHCEWSGNMYSFLKENSPHLYEQYKQEKRVSSFEWLKNQRKTEPEQEFEDAEIWLGTRDKPTAIKTENVNKVTLNPLTPVIDTVAVQQTGIIDNTLPPVTFKLPDEFILAENNEQAIKYITNREIDSSDIYFCKDWITFRGRKMPLKNSIIIPLWANKKEGLVYGFQARSTETKFFYTYIPEENTGYKCWNNYGVSKEKIIFCFESIFDAKSSGLPRDQIIAALGADLNNDRISELKEVIFCLDNQFLDNTSKLKSQELLKKGYKVFIWPTDIHEKDANAWKQNNPTKNFAKEILLKNIYEGTKGILKIKLKK